MSNIMIDLETMGNESNAAIVSIGAVKFSSEGLGEEFYAVVDLGSSMLAGGVVNPDTLKWWLGQSDEARGQLTRNDAVSLLSALQDFTKFVRPEPPVGLSNEISEDSEAKIWGNGAAFDNVILGNAFDSVNLKRPWNFWNDRCYRTIYNTFDSPSGYEPPKVAHNALADAKAQAAHLVKIVRTIEADPGVGGISFL